MSRALPFLSIGAAVALERLAAWVLYAWVGSSLLATGPQVILAAMLGLACLLLRLCVLTCAPVALVWAVSSWFSGRASNEAPAGSSTRTRTGGEPVR